MKLLFALIFLLDLNTATLEELDALPGIGPALAGRVVQFRERRGGFRRIEELLAIPGISEARWQVLRELVEVKAEAGEEENPAGATDRPADPTNPGRPAEESR